MAAFRPLQPAPMDDDSATPPQGRPLLTQKPKRTVTLGACVACRKRKSKCDGQRPVCTCCSQKDTSCVYELGPNEKPSQAMKRKNEEMQGELSNLRQLYDFLRLRPEHEAIEILRRIRANPADASSSQRIQELADFVKHGNTSTQQPAPPPASSPQHDPAKSVTLPPLRLALDSSNNIDPQLFSLPSILPMGTDGPVSQRRRYSPDDMHHHYRSENQASSIHPLSASLMPRPFLSTSPEASKKPDPRFAAARHWTAVHVEPELITRILSSWTAREYCFYHYLDKDAFLDDMNEKKTDFCSELLVNALLATAACTCPEVVDRSKPFSEQSAMTLFYREAKRLWQLDEGKESLPRLHAGICLYLFLGKQGRDKAAQPYLVEACRIGTSLGLYQSPHPPATHSPHSITNERWAHVRAVTAWSLFQFQLLMSFIYRFPAIIRTRPCMEIPYHKVPEAEALFRSECLRSLILADCNDVVQYSAETEQRARPMLHSQDADTWYHNLSSWYAARPSSLHPDYVPSQVNLLCAMMHQTSIIDVFQPFLNPATAPSGTPKAYTERAQRITSTALREIRRLILVQDLRHGWNHTIAIILHPLSVVGFGTLNEISQVYSNPIHAEGTEPYQGLLVCLRALCVMASYNYYGQPLFRLVTQKCQAMNFGLPSELQTAVEAYTTDEWTKAAAALVSSQYIADIRRLSLNADSARMDDIVSAWEGLSLEGDRDKRAASS